LISSIIGDVDQLIVWVAEDDWIKLKRPVA